MTVALVDERRPVEMPLSRGWRSASGGARPIAPDVMMRAVDDCPAFRIDAMTVADWPAVRHIYQEGIATGDATLEREAPDWDHFDRSHRHDCRLVARADADGQVLGWVALSSYSARRVYHGVAWESVYVAEAARGRGVGRALLEAAIRDSEAAGIWTLDAGILIENAASLVLHERAGFRRIGVQRALGQDQSGRWRDVVLLERRSTRVGV
jgi:phosphinothricin acetyltransferase